MAAYRMLTGQLSDEVSPAIPTKTTDSVFGMLMVRLLAARNDSNDRMESTSTTSCKRPWANAECNATSSAWIILGMRVLKYYCYY